MRRRPLPQPKTDEPPTRVITGRSPSGHPHRLSFYDDGTVKIERKPYVSPHDGSVTRLPDLREDTHLHRWLIHSVETNPL